jgi:hypothetical protein
MYHTMLTYLYRVPHKVHQRSGYRSSQSAKLIQNETTNLKTRLFRLDKEKQKVKFQPAPLSWPCIPVKHSSPLSHSSPNKFSRVAWWWVAGCYHHNAWMCMVFIWGSFKVKQSPKTIPLSILPICLKSLNTAYLPFFIIIKHRKPPVFNPHCTIPGR